MKWIRKDCDNCAHSILPDDGGTDIGMCIANGTCFEVANGLCRNASNDQPSKCEDWTPHSARSGA